jgi:FAD:protein FMN transferase
LNLGGIGKGYALDRAGQAMLNEDIGDWLIHGGHSSLLAHGDHNRLGGWPVGIRNPLFPDRRLATIVLQNCALSSSGSGVQHFRHAGRRYGHILDPRTGWPVEGMLSVTVLAPTAAEADALSTAFFVIGVENARRYCDNHQGIRALLIPPPERGRRLEPVNCGIPEELLFWNFDESLSR